MNWLQNVVVPVVTAVVVSGLLVSLLRIRAERRQINAGAGKDEATTADILTGTALKMVQHAQDEAARASVEVVNLRTEGTALRKLVEDANTKADAAVRTSVECAAEVMKQSQIIQAYAEELVRHGIAVPQV